MKQKKLLLLSFMTLSLFLISSKVFALPSSNLVYNETDLGGGVWQYDYTFYNTSTNNEYLYSINLLFNQEATVNGAPLPTGWDSTIWEGANQTDFIMTFSTDSIYDVAAGGFLSGFSFTIDYHAGNTSYNAFFDDHQGNISNTSGYTTMVPEPVSSVLFILGGAMLGYGRVRKKNSLKKR